MAIVEEGQPEVAAPVRTRGREPFGNRRQDHHRHRVAPLSSVVTHQQSQVVGTGFGERDSCGDRGGVGNLNCSRTAHFRPKHVGDTSRRLSWNNNCAQQCRRAKGDNLIRPGFNQEVTAFSPRHVYHHRAWRGVHVAVFDGKCKSVGTEKAACWRVGDVRRCSGQDPVLRRRHDEKCERVTVLIDAGQHNVGRSVLLDFDELGVGNRHIVHRQHVDGDGRGG